MSKIQKKGLYQATTIALYCLVVGLVMTNAEKVFGKMPDTIGPVIFLLLFSGSVLFCGLAVFYQPYILFFDKKRKEAADLVVSTTIWLFVFFVVALMLTIVL